jgi:ABC-type sugar transport system ATPase subunit
MLIGLARADAGTIRIAGIDCSKNPKAAQDLMGVVPDESNLYPELTGFDNLSFCGALYGMSNRDREAVGVRGRNSLVVHKKDASCRLVATRGVVWSCVASARQEAGDRIRLAL